MRRLALAFVAAGFAVLPAGGAAAKTTLSAKTVTYGVSGDTGIALIKAMDRKGPRHGFMTRAIAQTSYTVGWEFTWTRQANGCRLAGAEGSLDLKYTYPELATPVSADLGRRWDRFMAGVRKHEENHGRLAREMVRQAERAVKGMRFPGDPSCRLAQDEVKRRITLVYLKYEARQIAFDKREHRDGGNVEHLLFELAGRE